MSEIKQSKRIKSNGKVKSVENSNRTDQTQPESCPSPIKKLTEESQTVNLFRLLSIVCPNQTLQGN